MPEETGLARRREAAIFPSRSGVSKSTVSNYIKEEKKKRKQRAEVFDWLLSEFGQTGESKQDPLRIRDWAVQICPIGDFLDST